MDKIKNNKPNLDLIFGKASVIVTDLSNKSDLDYETEISS